VGRDIAVLIAFCLFITVPFIDKAFHIDDPAFICAARAILDKPFEPYNFLISLPEREFRFFESMPHPPLVSYLIAVVMFVTGKIPEIPIHVTFIPLTTLAAVAMYFLARRFTSHPLSSSVLLLTSPAFMVNSHQAMSDIPMLAFWLAAMACYIYGTDNNDRRLIVVSVVLINLASMTKYPGVLVLPILMVYSLMRRHSLRRILLTSVSSFVALGLWSIHNVLVMGKIHILSILRQESYVWSINPSLELSQYVSRIIEVVAHLGGAILVPIVLIFALRRRTQFVHWSVAILVAAASSIFAARAYPGGYKIGFAIFVASGVVLLLLAIGAGGGATLRYVQKCARGGRGHEENDVKDDIFAFLWVVVVCLYLVAMPPFVAARYVLPLLPPIILLSVNALSRWSGSNRGWVNGVCATAIVLGLGVAVVVSIADFRYAAIYREFGRYVRTTYVAHASTVWVNGFWGFRYYLEVDGAKPLRNREVAAGDIVVTSRMATLFELSPEIEREKRLIEEIAYRDRFKVRSFNREAHAGFYSDLIGLLPYSYSGAELDRLSVYRVGGEGVPRESWRPGHEASQKAGIVTRSCRGIAVEGTS